VGVTVNESRHYHAASGVDFLGVPGESKILQPSTRPDFSDQAIDNQDSAILNEP